MKAHSILNTFLNDVTSSMHKTRRQSLKAMMTSLMSGARLSVTSLGRHITSQTTEKHQIKRSMRLCSNLNLQAERNGIYSAMVSRLIGQQARPVILVDWSDLDPRKQHFLLRASVAVEGRSLTVFEDIYPLSLKEKPATHKVFMQRLKSCLPDNCRPIIVTDAGFRVPWFRLIESLGWDYVGRVRNRTFCQKHGETDWSPIKHLYANATSKPKSLGEYQLCRNTPITLHLCLYQSQHQGRHDLTATGDKARKSKHSRVHAEREKEPWLLATSLDKTTRHFAKKIVKIYQTRMQIEESFRDLKTGLHFNLSNTRHIERLKVLLLIAMLGQYALFLLGLAVKCTHQHRRYQANSVKTRTVLSYQFIGLRAMKDKHLKLRRCDFNEALMKLQQLIREPLNV